MTCAASRARLLELSRAPVSFQNANPAEPGIVISRNLPSLLLARRAAKEMMAAHPLFGDRRAEALAVTDLRGATLLVVPNHEHVWAADTGSVGGRA